MAKFLKEEDKKTLIDAVKEAENQTSGEIVVSIVKHVKGDIYAHAQSEFIAKGIDKTKDRNGVLVLVAYKDHKLVILGDEGINEKVPDDFWQETVSLMTTHFKEGEHVLGLKEGILHIGVKLKEYFPWQDDDENELEDEIHVEQ